MKTKMAERLMACAMIAACGAMLMGCSSGSNNNQWSGGGDTYGDGVSGLQQTSPATSYWSSGSTVTVTLVNATNGILKVEPYEAASDGELLMPLEEFYLVAPETENTRQVRLPRQSQQDMGVSGRLLSLTITALGPDGGYMQSWIVPAGQGVSLRATAGAQGGVNLSYANGTRISGQ